MSVAASGTARSARRKSSPLVGLIGDIGGTNARFAIGRYANGQVTIDHLRVLQAADYPRGEDAVRAYLASLDGAVRPRFGVIAAAGPIEAGEVAFTNNTATMDLSAIKQKGKAKKAAVQTVEIPLANIEKANLIPEI